VSDVELSGTAVVRAARPEDAAAVAGLHARRISEGFLPTLGSRFLARLYRRIVRSPLGCVFVVDDGGQVVAFAAGATDVSRLYREFVVRDGIVAGITALPRLARSWRRVYETLRYPATTTALPPAEVLAVATSENATGRGLGGATVRAVTDALAALGASAVKVTVGADNDAALAMYRGCGFASAAQIRVHGDTISEVLVWTAP
jgi:ribosomal protein S18 acetylase RimI-like enzyme